MWYSYAQENVEKFSHPLLRYLAAEARKCETFEEFKHDYVSYQRMNSLACSKRFDALNNEVG